MLSRKYRASKDDIEETIKNGFNIQGNFVYAKVSRDKKDINTFAIIISKKTEKTSVGRHLIKRRISSALEDIVKNNEKDYLKTIVFFYKKSEKVPETSLFHKDISEILGKVL
ncbi:MAG: ribonuclease P protein component [Candidatus Taylorbacteria bacterium]|nr:ribonuclease P protein component [Candidatus Taylorbacteria bacterium]